MHGRIVPTLRETVDAGDHWFATAMLASPDGKSDWKNQPVVRRTDAGFTVVHDGTTLLTCTHD